LELEEEEEKNKVKFLLKLYKQDYNRKVNKVQTLKEKKKIHQE
jgi:hypothetical protein